MHLLVLRVHVGGERELLLLEHALVPLGAGVGGSGVRGGRRRRAPQVDRLDERVQAQNRGMLATELVKVGDVERVAGVGERDARRRRPRSARRRRPA
jgi:hypothetical protein